MGCADFDHHRFAWPARQWRLELQLEQRLGSRRRQRKQQSRYQGQANRFERILGWFSSPPEIHTV
jgi:hypothetical protein